MSQLRKESPATSVEGMRYAAGGYKLLVHIPAGIIIVIKSSS